MIAEKTAIGAQAMGLTLDEKACENMARYHQMLIEANAQFNLTRVPDEPQEAVDRNYLDSLTPLCHNLLSGVQKAIDVGTGAGLPGLPLSIACPQIHITLLDSLGKRVKFLDSVVQALGLNAAAVHARAEEAARLPHMRDAFDVAMARAVAPMNVLCELLLPFVRPGGKLIALKGPSAEEELAQAENAIKRLGGGKPTLLPAPIPGRDWQHNIVVIPKITKTPREFPRKPGDATRKPL